MISSLEAAIRINIKTAEAINSQNFEYAVVIILHNRLKN